MLHNPKWDKPTTVSEMLRKAADLIETRGHAKSALVILADTSRVNRYAKGPVGSLCIQGALFAAEGYSDDEISGWPMSSALFAQSMETLQKHVVQQWTTSSAVQWNNHHRTTKEQVVTKLREVAELVDA